MMADGFTLIARFKRGRLIVKMKGNFSIVQKRSGMVAAGAILQ